PEVNRIVDSIVKMYENDYGSAPAGKTFQECYNVKTIEPTDEYMKVYERARKKLEGLGLVF
uniref:monomethylamine:corrinoid methyltransferase n=1 Tax=Methanomethylovorans sp. TaxID=2758717 RepID=UPI001BD5B321